MTEPTEPTEPAAAPEAPVVADHVDFRRPPPLGSKLEKTLELVQEEYADRLGPLVASRLRQPFPVRPAGREVTGSLDLGGDPPAILAVVDLAPLPGCSVLRLPLDLGLRAVDILLGGSGEMVTTDRPVTEIELDVLRTLLERWVEPLRAAWSPLLPVKVSLEGVGTDAAELGLEDDGCPWLGLHFDAALGEREYRVGLWVPAGGVHAAVRADATPTRPLSPVGAAAPVLAGVLQSVPVEVSVEFPPAPVPSTTLLALKPGDVIPLGLPVDETLSLRVGEVDVGIVRPARHGRRVACQVVVGPRRYRATEHEGEARTWRR